MDNHNNPHLGVNKLGKNIRKSPVHHSYLRPQPHPSQHHPPPPLNHPPNQPQPQVYNISKNEFRSIVQKLTGTPSRVDPPLPTTSPNVPFPRPPSAIVKQPPSNRLQRIRPPPLTPIARAPSLPPQQPLAAHPHPPLMPIPNSNVNFRLPSPISNPLWASASESPVSAYMRYLENSIVNQPNPPTQLPPQQHQGGLLPVPSQNPQQQALGSPLPSPSAFLNLLSPLSPHPLLSPNFHFPPPLSPSLLGSPFTQAGGGGGILGSGPQQPPPSPGLLLPPSPLPLSPPAFLLSPRWRNFQ